MSIYPQDGTAPHSHYQLYVSGHGVYAEDRTGKVAEIGVIEAKDGELAYHLEMDGLWGAGFLTAEKLLQDVAAKLAYASLHRFFGTAPSAPSREGGPAALRLLLENEEPGEHPPAGSAAE
ncbi:hypothetical protein CDO44_03340 [Pigmentiphaga sp. NML080357]|uniref:hypothetical protein n=1 Tax=Pigmentiphaga sp. NML080357 TaxID=2008675 RepID=UPI000B41F807|nr:hypothetical protein [Pigmentiphaga sp. NML080357]OVZ63706.1 hypothetical protein CDO44_03340 [Pigmentiphaga sp. NML080357]